MVQSAAAHNASEDWGGDTSPIASTALQETWKFIVTCDHLGNNFERIIGEKDPFCACTWPGKIDMDSSYHRFIPKFITLQYKKYIYF